MNGVQEVYNETRKYIGIADGFLNPSENLDATYSRNEQPKDNTMMYLSLVGVAVVGYIIFSKNKKNKKRK